MLLPASKRLWPTTRPPLGPRTVCRILPPPNFSLPTHRRSPMYLMRIGAPGEEKPVVRISDTHYVDVSDVVGDFDETFFGQDWRTLSETVANRAAAGATG